MKLFILLVALVRWLLPMPLDYPARKRRDRRALLTAAALVAVLFVLVAAALWVSAAVFGQ